MTGRMGYDRKDRNDFIGKSKSRLILSCAFLIHSYIYIRGTTNLLVGPERMCLFYEHVKIYKVITSTK